VKERLNAELQEAGFLGPSVPGYSAIPFIDPLGYQAAVGARSRSLPYLTLSWSTGSIELGTQEDVANFRTAYCRAGQCRGAAP
jgi:hypothetical protein